MSNDKPIDMLTLQIENVARDYGVAPACINLFTDKILSIINGIGKEKKEREKEKI